MMRDNPFDDFEELLDRFEQGLDIPMPDGVSVDLIEEDDTYVVVADLPGYDVADIEVTYTNRQLQITGQRTETRDVDTEQYLRRERHQQMIDRTVTIPGAVDDAAITATHNNGVLEVTLPKASPDEAGHRIDIE